MLTNPIPVFPYLPLTVRAARVLLIAHLQRHGVEDAEAVAEFLLAERLGVRRSEVVALHGRRLLADDDANRLAEQAERLARHEPLQYVLGTAVFGGRVFACDHRALIPRPETELLVETVLESSGLWTLPAPDVADIGTGTGCIAITLALERPRARVVAIDLHEAALELARENARHLGAAERVEFRADDLLTGWLAGALDAVVANLPYITTDELAGLDRNVREHEPASALDGGPDGLRLIERLIAQASTVLRPDGHIFLEIGETQGTRTAALLATAGFRDITVARDLAGHERIVAGRR